MVQRVDFKDIPAGSNPCYVTPAYGKSYTSVDEVVADWADGKDFKIYQGQYCSIRDVVRLRMSKFTHIAFVWQVSDNVVHHHMLELK